MSITAPNLTGRMARCYCGTERSSDTALAFFEFCGEGSATAVKSCKHCHYFEEAHGKPGVSQFVCDHFEPNGPLDHDRFYCGHAGWD